MDFIIYTRRIGRYLKGEYVRRFRRGLLKYEMARGFLADIKKEFKEGNEETVKIAELKVLEQREKTIKVFVQEFKKVAKGSRYEERLLVKEFKRGINRTIC